MKIRFKIFIGYFLLSFLVSPAVLDAQILKDTASLEILRKGINYVYNFQFKDAEEIYSKINQAYPDHPVPLLFKGMMTYWKDYPLLPTSPDCASYEENMRRCIELCEKKNNPDNDPETLLSNLCARGLLLLFYTDNDMSLEVFPLATTTYPLIRRSFNFTKFYPDFYFFTGLYNYYREAYPDNYPAYKPLAILFPKGDKAKGLKEIGIASTNSIVLKAEAFSFLSSINLGFENNFQKAFSYSKSLHELYPGNLQYLAEYIKNLLLMRQYDEAERIINSSASKISNPFFQAQTTIFNGILQEKKYHDNRQAEIYYNKGARAISMFGDFGNEFEAFAYFGLSRISNDYGDKHYKRTYRKLALKLAAYKKIDFDN
jgi:hypothetical protein